MSLLKQKTYFYQFIDTSINHELKFKRTSYFDNKKEKDLTGDLYGLNG